jgi:hypothetical protein
MSAAKSHAGWPVISAHASATQALLDEPPHPYELLAERAKGICLLTRLWAQSDVAHAGVRPSAR